MALDALKTMHRADDGDCDFALDQCWKAMKALDAELAKPEPEPVGYFVEYPGNEWARHTFEQLADVHANDTDVVCVPLYRKEDAE